MLDMYSLVVLWLAILGTEAGYKAYNLTKTSTAIYGYLESSEYHSISPLFLNVSFETAHRIRIRITDAIKDRYEVPYPEPETYKNSPNIDNTAYNVFVNETTFAITIQRKDAGSTVFSTVDRDLFYANQHITWATSLSSELLYGLGEDSGPLLRDMNNKKHTLWTAGGFYQQGQGVNLYGSHPFYLNLEASGKANGVLLLNSNAMDILLSKKPVPAVTWITTGGIIDLSIFIGKSPVHVIQMYTERVGRTFLPPIWSLGYQLCRWGYNTTGYMDSVLDDMVDQNVPVDVQWNDIDYMDHNKDFTVSQRFNGLPEHVDKLHRLGKRYVMMIDPAINVNFSQQYLPFKMGVEQDVFIRNASGDLLIGKVWPGDTVFPDFLYKETEEWWGYWIKHIYKSLDFDGVWIDMNEPQSFYDGSNVGCPWNSPLEKPPYYPGVRERLQWNTVCLSARQHSFLHYDVHNLYGWSEAQATYRVLKTLRPSNRTFILSRSTFVGSGRWAAHWTGDISASWSDLRATIPALINMNMFGISMIGADICGFNGDSNKELCIRWSQLGAFYPLSRNHNTLFGRTQEPTAWGTEATAIIRDVLNKRYRLLLYLYNLFVKAHSYGDPVVQALFMQFPTDPETYDKDRQFLWGENVMICPVVEEGADMVWTYFPDAQWYNLWTFELVSKSKEVKWMSSPLDTINIFARGGAIIPVVDDRNDFTAEHVLYTRKLNLYSYLDQRGTASGSLYVDDGFTDSPDQHHLITDFRIQNNILEIKPRNFSPLFIKTIEHVKIGGVFEKISKITVNAFELIHYSHNPEVGLLDLQLNSLEVTTYNFTTITWYTEYAISLHQSETVKFL